MGNWGRDDPTAMRSKTMKGFILDSLYLELSPVIDGQPTESVNISYKVLKLNWSSTYGFKKQSNFQSNRLLFLKIYHSAFCLLTLFTVTGVKHCVSALY